MLSALVVVVQRPVFFWNGFDNDLEQPAPIGAGWARSHLRPWPFSQAEADATVRFFSRWDGGPNELGKIRLTLRNRGAWLDVDSEGLAVLNGRRGRFDVLGFARFVRASPRRTRALGAVSMVVVRVANRSGRSVSVRSRNGLSGARAPAGGTARFLTWGASHRVSDGRRSAEVGFPFNPRPTDPWAPPSWLRVRRTSLPAREGRRPPYAPHDVQYEIVVTD